MKFGFLNFKQESMEDIEKKEFMRYIRKNKKREYIDYRLNQISTIMLKKPYIPTPKRVVGKKVLDFQETNSFLYNAILEAKPFWAGRYGMSEMKLMVAVLMKKYDLSDSIEEELNRICDLSGFFPNEEKYAVQFTEQMIEICKNVDLHAVWRMNMEDFFIDQYEKNVQLTKLSWLEPWNSYRFEKDEYEKIIPWTAALRGKKVLVIHPFEDSIQNQYSQHRKDIFSKLKMADEILPEFELHTMKAVQTLAGERDKRFETWFDALNFMVEQCRETEFDVAILGCGAYGFPLAAEIKKMGKIAIHLGGATQLMFGILGGRWEGNKKFMELVVNEAWNRPLESEKIANRDKVEKSCYW